MKDKNVIASQLSGQQFSGSVDMMAAQIGMGMSWPHFGEKLLQRHIGERQWGVIC